MAKLSFRKLLIILFILLCLSIIVFALVVAYHTKKDINETKNTWDKIHACYDKWKGSARVWERRSGWGELFLPLGTRNSLTENDAPKEIDLLLHPGPHHGRLGDEFGYLPSYQ